MPAGTAQARIAEFRYSQGVCVGDYDDDGFDDVYVTNIDGNTLFHNQGDGTFLEVTESAGVRDGQRAVAPDGEHAAGAQHALALAEEAPDVEPVQRLRDGDQVARGGRETGVFRGRHAVLDAGIGHRPCNLLRRGIRGDHAAEAHAEIARCLPAAGRAVPHEPARRHDRGQPVEQGARVGGTKCRVGAGDGGEAIDEFPGHCTPVEGPRRPVTLARFQSWSRSRGREACQASISGSSAARRARLSGGQYVSRS